MTPEDAAARENLTENADSPLESPSELLADLLKFDNDGGQVRDVDSLFFPFGQQFPETARWCLSALKNLTRPQQDGSVCQILIDTGVVPIILRYITVGGNPLNAVHEYKRDSSEHHGSESSSSDTPTPVDPTQRYVCMAREGKSRLSPCLNLCRFVVPSEEPSNDPSMWDSHSMQDSALSIAMNLAATASSRSYVRDIHGIRILTHIAESRDRALTANRDYSIEEIKQLEFQCMKAVSLHDQQVNIT